MTFKFHAVAIVFEPRSDTALTFEASPVKLLVRTPVKIKGMAMLAWLALIRDCFDVLWSVLATLPPRW